MIENIAEVRMLHDNILVKPMKDREVTAGGIIIPDHLKEKGTIGQVLAVGKPHGMTLETEVGDIIYYGKMSGLPVPSSEGDLLFMREIEVFAKILTD